MIRRFAAALVVLSLAGCNSSNDASEAPPTDEASVAVAETPAPAASSTRELQIPAALRGRWGLVAADCEPGRADAKGLMVVSGDKLEFYESVGTLGTASERLPQSIRAGFAFTGEGMTWTREMALETDGMTLTRTEFGPEAMPDPLRYTKCS